MGRGRAVTGIVVASSDAPSRPAGAVRLRSSWTTRPKAMVLRHLEISVSLLEATADVKHAGPAQDSGIGEMPQMQITHTAPIRGDNMTTVPGVAGTNAERKRPWRTPRIAVQRPPARRAPAPPARPGNPCPPLAGTPPVPREGEPKPDRLSPVGRRSNRSDGGIDMADAKTTSAVAETTEGQIAVHWKEEEYFDPPASFVAQANLKDPAVNERFAEKNFPKCFEEYAEMLTWFRKWDDGARHERSAVLEVVRRRKDQRLLQLRRPSPREAQEQGRDHLRAGARRRGSRHHHVPGALRSRERIRRAAARLRGPEGGRPRHDPHADGRRAADHDARVRAPRRRSLGRLRRVLRRGLRAARRRLGQPRPDLHGRVLPQRQDDRPQGGGGDRGRDGREGRPVDRQGPGLAALSRQVRVGRARW